MPICQESENFNVNHVGAHSILCFNLVQMDKVVTKMDKIGQQKWKRIDAALCFCASIVPQINTKSETKSIKLRVVIGWF
jgi:hypothetical protein